MATEQQRSDEPSRTGLGSVRKNLRNTLFGLLRRVFATDDGRSMAAGALGGLLRWKPNVEQLAGDSLREIYPDLAGPPAVERPCQRDDVVIITGRFRSGSTLMWNLFRQIKGVTAYYEPLNERRWFDPELRGDQVDPSHLNVSDYWREYEKLGELSTQYRSSWIDKNLYMDADHWAPNLKQYLETLIERAPGRPVLQSNRIDFRLPWIRRNFPKARLVHLYRHPRDAWFSSLMGPNPCPREISPAEFAAYDELYLLNWARDLQYHFPFLAAAQTDHPYQIFYYLWKLSFLFGSTYCDYGLSFESLVEQPEQQLGEMLEVLELRDVNLSPLAGMIEKPATGGWRSYADDAWFRQHESICEQILDDFLNSGGSQRR